MRSSTRLIATLAAVGLLATACGDSAAEDASGTAEGSPDADSGADESESEPASEAVAFLDEHDDNPTELDLQEPLSETPEPGKRVVRLTTPVPVSEIADEASAEAAEALGWQYSSINVESGAEGVQRAFQSALALNPAPDAIVMSGFPAVTYAQQLAEAKERGIKVVVNSVTDDSGTEETPDAVITGGEQTYRWGEMVASYVVANSDGPTEVALFNISSYPVLQPFEEGFEESLAEWCPECSVRVVDQQPEDIGTNTPQSVVSEFQRNPDLEWAIFALGDMAIGVPAALESAGLSDQVRIAGESATEANLEAIRNGTEEAWTGYASPYLGWAAIDAVARLLIGDDITPAEEAFAPSQIVTADNIDDIATAEGGYYIGLDGYEDEFKRLWGVE